MPDVRPPQERLQPALLDRLTDLEPDKKLEARHERVISERRLRDAVRRDLEWLFSTTRLDADMDGKRYKYARASVVNFGLPALSGRPASSIDATVLEKAIQLAIVEFEPRILKGSLTVRAIERGDFDVRNTVGVEIAGHLWAQPIPLELLMRTEIDLESGKVTVSEVGRPGERLMDARFLHYYNLELQHLREMGEEFGKDFPKIAARLGMKGLEVADPYVERLLEGVGFMAARVQLKLDAEFPRFTQTLLEIIYPHYLAPTPSMLVAQFHPERKDPSLASGTRTIPRGTALHSIMAPGDVTACEFRTAHDVTLLPIEVESASCFSFAPDLPLTTLPFARKIKGGLRIRLKTAAGVRFEQTTIDRLCFYLAGRDDVANTLLELCLASGLGVLVRAVGAAASDVTLLPSSSIRPVGFADTEALLPVTQRSFQGYRLIQEYFSFPQRYRFVELTGLADAIRRAAGTDLELVVLFGRSDASLEGIVDRSNVQLFCTPAVNLFEKRHLDRINVTDTTHEFQVIPDRTRPLDFEVYEITGVVGHAAGDDGEQPFMPFYSASSAERDYTESAYFTTRRVPRLVPEETKRRGSRSSYVGSEVFLSLVDASQAPYAAALRQLSLQALCTNRDLVLLTSFDLGETDFSLSIAAPVTSVRVVSGPSRPYPALADGSIAWQAVSHLSLNYLSLVNATGQQGASALRDLLALYARRIGGDGDRQIEPQIARQIEGIRFVGVERMVRRLPQRGPLAFGRGLEITVEVEEPAFEGGSAFLLGAVLHHYFARYVSINCVTETVLRSQSRGEINRWTPTWGTRPTL